MGNDRDIIIHHLSYFLQSDIVDLENILDETKYVVTDAAIEQVCVVKADDTNDVIEQSDTRMSVGVNLCHLLHRHSGGGGGNTTTGCPTILYTLTLVFCF